MFYFVLSQSLTYAKDGITDFSVSNYSHSRKNFGKKLHGNVKMPIFAPPIQMVHKTNSDSDLSHIIYIMTKIYRFLVSTLILCLSSPCAAQVEEWQANEGETPHTPAPVTREESSPLITQLISIGFLSYDSAITSMPGYALAQSRLQELRQAYEKELKRVEDEFNQKYEAFLDGMKDFPRTILLKRQTELQQLLQSNLDFKQRGLEELAEAEEEAMSPLRASLDRAISTVARQKGLALVVNTDSHACPFIDPDMGVDLQQDVARHLKR